MPEGVCDFLDSSEDLSLDSLLMLLTDSDKLTWISLALTLAADPSNVSERLVLFRLAYKAEPGNLWAQADDLEGSKHLSSELEVRFVDLAPVRAPVLSVAAVVGHGF